MNDAFQFGKNSAYESRSISSSKNKYPNCTFWQRTY